MSDIDHSSLNKALSEIRHRGALPANSWPDAGLAYADLGLIRQGDSLLWPQTPDLLNHAKIEQAFMGASAHLGVAEVEVFDCIDSTNTYLLSRPTRAAGMLCTAELQVGGRGRRGRSWISPYARNLAMSMGFASRRALVDLGGLSSVVGLALASGLEECGVGSVQLKWPNDVLVDGRKLCGILVELVTRPDGIEYVVGIGVNVSLTDEEIQQIGQPAVDLRRLGVQAGRTELLIALLTRVREFLQHFELQGFSSFVPAFNDAHIYHLQQCDIIQGEERLSGIVQGIGEHGELCLRTADGDQYFHGGEVSLRSVGTS